jgi:hypothetical protein
MATDFSLTLSLAHLSENGSELLQVAEQTVGETLVLAHKKQDCHGGFEACGQGDAARVEAWAKDLSGRFPGVRFSLEVSYDGGEPYSFEYPPQECPDCTPDDRYWHPGEAPWECTCPR